MKRKSTMNKGVLYTFFFSLLTIHFLTSCSKSNDTINAGTTTAAIKTILSVGPAGPANSLIYYGNGPLQDTTVGCFGDYYLNTSQGLLYGPKSVYGWGNAFALQDATAAENQIYSGTTTPAAGFGNTGDYYLDTKTFTLFGPKGSTGWNYSINLQGSGE